MFHVITSHPCIANQKELVTDLITKAKQIEYLINSLPEPEAEEEQVVFRLMVYRLVFTYITGETASNSGRRDDDS